jgi:hypothetical protein
MRKWLVPLALIISLFWWAGVFLHILGRSMGDCFPGQQAAPCPTDVERRGEVTKALIWGPVLYALFLLGIWVLVRWMNGRRKGG